MSANPDLPAASLDDARSLLAATEALLDKALASARKITDGGRRIDDHQVTCERVAYATTEARAVRELLAWVDRAKEKVRELRDQARKVADEDLDRRRREREGRRGER